MTPDDITRSAGLLDAVLIEVTMGAGTPIALNSKGKGSADYETLAKYVSINVGTVAAKLRTLAQQGKAGGVEEVEEVGYVNQDGSVTWLTDGPYSQYSLKPKPGAKIYTAAPQPKAAP